MDALKGVLTVVDKGVRFASAKEFKGLIDETSAVVDVAMAMARAWPEGLDVVSEVLVASQRSFDDRYLWAAMAFMSSKLPEADPDTVAWTGLVRNKRGISTATREVLTAKQRADEEANVRVRQGSDVRRNGRGSGSMTSAVTPWWETLKIRPEIIHSSGQIDDVQMSLFQAVHGKGHDRPPYAEPSHYGEITHPSPQFIDLMAKIAVRLGGATNYTAAPALWRLDQAMGGGKSHGLIGLNHLAAHPAELRITDVGRQASDLAQKIVGAKMPMDLNRPQVVVLACDNMTAGKGVQEYDGPATTLHERFLWRLFGKDYALYERYQPYHADKSKIVDALRAVGRPVLILVDEIMDYIRQLSDSGLHDLAVKDMAFLRALLDSVNDVANVAMVVVMIASEKDSMDLDAAGQSRRAELDQLLVRNGKPATINDNTDFAAILRRRLFESVAPREVLTATSQMFARMMANPWRSKVFDILGAGWTREWDAEVARCYPFHPQLIALAEREWAQLSGFQRVRSTIRIFAATVYTLAQRTKLGDWAPMLIGPGDLPLADAAVREAVIGSGLIGDTSDLRTPTQCSTS